MKKFIFLALFGILPVLLNAQNSKKTISHDVYDSWNDLMNPDISQDGNWVTYEINPQDGDGNLWLVGLQKGFKKSFSRGYKAAISPANEFVVFQIKPEKKIVRKAKLDKKKKDDMPKDSLGIFVFGNGNETGFNKVKSYKMGETAGTWVAIYTDELKKSDKKQVDSTKKAETKPVKKAKPDEQEKTGRLMLVNPISGQQYQYEKVADYAVSKNGLLFSFTTKSGDSLKLAQVQIFDTRKPDAVKIFEQKGEVLNLVFDEIGSQLVFQFTADTGKVKIYDLYYWNQKENKTEKIISSQTSGMMKGWVVSQNTIPFFSKSGGKLYLYTMPKPVEVPKDTLTDDEKVILDLWSYTDTLLQSQQKVNLKEDEKKSYLAVYHFKDKKIVQLADKAIPRLKVPLEGEAPYALGESELPYQFTMTWDSPTKSDFYLINTKTGARNIVVKGNPFRVFLSPSGNFVAYYQVNENAWYSWSLKENKSTCLTAGLKVNFYNEENDVPQIPYPYGFAGWVEGDKYLLVYDKFDIWALDPTGKLKPVCLTGGKGRIGKNVYRYLQTDPKEEYITFTKPILLSTFDEVSKKDGFSAINISNPGEINILLTGDFKYTFAKKSNHSNQVIWQRESFKEYRDLWVSNLLFENIIKLSEANPQMADYKWGSVELVKWVDFNRDSIQGLLYKPDDFDPGKRYPMMVYFYETHTDNLHSHFEPKPGRSVICPTLYTSNDYLVFFPDIRYRVGTPGKSAYDAVISGTMALISKGFVDKDRIGVQGQSWGGYQIAYLVTQTDLFKAASAGAPVSNMTSAYGGIRWESGMARMFQYEHTQSRIGGTLWDKPLNFIENSPIFYAPRVNTPLLIRHDDADGAVPWYQGIEYFLALRRLGKTVWMVNYNDEPHNLVRRANRIDWAIRMQQFFDYYLKGAPMPVWMKEGIPAIKKGKTLGY